MSRGIPQWTVAKNSQTVSNEWQSKWNRAKTILTDYSWNEQWCGTPSDSGDRTVDVQSTVDRRSQSIRTLHHFAEQGIVSWWTSTVCAGQGKMEGLWPSYEVVNVVVLLLVDKTSILGNW